MRKSTIAIAGLSVALVASNAFWFYKMLDAGVSYTYLQDSFMSSRVAAQQALTLLPIASRLDSNRDSVIAAYKRAYPGEDVLEKDGFTWLGGVGLRFDEAGRIVEATDDQPIVTVFPKVPDKALLPSNPSLERP